MGKHNLTFEFPDEESKDAFIGWFLDGGGDQSFDPDGEMRLGFSFKGDFIVVEKFDEERQVIKLNNICEDCGNKATFRDDPYSPNPEDEDTGAWLCGICYDIREEDHKQKNS